MLELVGELTTAPQWSQRAAPLAAGRPNEPSYYFEAAGEYARRSAQAKTPPVALRWGFFLNMPVESFQSAVEKHGR